MELENAIFTRDILEALKKELNANSIGEHILDESWTYQGRPIKEFTNRELAMFINNLCFNLGINYKVQYCNKNDTFYA